MLNQTEIEILLPEVLALKGIQQRRDWHPEVSAYTHTMNVVKRAPDNLYWVAMLHDIGKISTTTPDGRSIGHEQESVRMLPPILKRLGITGQEAKDITWIVKNHMRIKQFWKMRRFKRDALMDHPRFLDLAIFCGADREVGDDPTPSLIEHYDMYRRTK